MKHFKDRAFAGGEPLQPYQLPIHGDIADVRFGKARDHAVSRAVREMSVAASGPKPPPARDSAEIFRLRTACAQRRLWFDQIAADMFRIRDRASGEPIVRGNFKTVIKFLDAMPLAETAREVTPE